MLSPSGGRANSGSGLGRSSSGGPAMPPGTGTLAAFQDNVGPGSQLGVSIGPDGSRALAPAVSGMVTAALPLLTDGSVTNIAYT